jgi:hypothetical protein
MKKDLFFYQQDQNFQTSQFDYSNEKDENLINRKGVALDLPVTPVVPEPEFHSKLEKKTQQSVVDRMNEIISDGSSYNHIESVPSSQLRYETNEDSFNTLEIIFLIIIFIATFKVLTSKTLYSNSNYEKDTFKNDAENLRKKEENLEKIKIFKELMRKRDNDEITWEKCDELVKELFNR